MYDKLKSVLRVQNEARVIKEKRLKEQEKSLQNILDQK